MKSLLCMLLVFTGINIHSLAQSFSPDLIGYWHNWNDPNAPSFPLNQIDSRYTIVDVAFAIPTGGTDYKMEFIPDQFSNATFISHIQALQNQGKKVIISIGGASTHVSLDNIAERDTFILTMANILDTFGFDGIDIDLEGSSVSVTGGTISSPIDAKIIHLIDAIKQIMANYYSTHNKKLMLTMAPETAFVQGGMSAYGGIWGAYLPLIQALRDSMDILHVQLYNSGSMYGIDGNIYTQGNSDFIVSQTEAVIQGFNTSGGMFVGLPQEKVAIGLPACNSAAGGGYTDTASVKLAIDYLRGTGPKPGLYTLQQLNGYTQLRGMMTWSINWDAVSTCASAYEFASNYENIFSVTTFTNEVQSTEIPIDIFPNPTASHFSIRTHKDHCAYRVVNILGELIQEATYFNQFINVDASGWNNGIYFITIDSEKSSTAKKINVFHD
ncbi:MAG: T9SS type A sorting domain-containing protein [Bacteroidetes bacterium]|nr:T9SS type A sorting domain-containing protein [Bacteroidota bacterium]